MSAYTYGGLRIICCPHIRPHEFKFVGPEFFCEACASDVLDEAQEVIEEQP